jgi:hypothetical protein
VTIELYRLFRILIFFTHIIIILCFVFSASPFSGPRRHALLVPVSIPDKQIAALPLARDCGPVACTQRLRAQLRECRASLPDFVVFQQSHLPSHACARTCSRDAGRRGKQTEKASILEL